MRCTADFEVCYTGRRCRSEELQLCKNVVMHHWQNLGLLDIWDHHHKRMCDAGQGSKAEAVIMLRKCEKVFQGMIRS